MKRNLGACTKDKRIANHNGKDWNIKSFGADFSLLCLWKFFYSVIVFIGWFPKSIPKILQPDVEKFWNSLTWMRLAFSAP